MQKAFDCVNWTKLTVILKGSGIDSYAKRLIISAVYGSEF